MKKRLLLLLALIVGLLALAVPTVVFAHNQALSPTTFYACEAPTTDATAQVTAGQVDADTITQDSSLNCSTSFPGFTQPVQWNVQGIPGTPGQPGEPGAPGQPGAVGAPGIPFSHAACTETLTGSQQQENLVFCISGIEPDSSFVYQAAIAAAAHQIIVGTPISTAASVDWGGTAITYVEFTSGFHAEYHADLHVRFYNTLNRQVF